MQSPPWLLLPLREQETLRHQHLPALAQPWTTALRRHTRPKRDHAVCTEWVRVTDTKYTDMHRHATYKDIRGQHGRLLLMLCTRTQTGRTCSPLPYAGCRSPRRAGWQSLSHREVCASRRHGRVCVFVFVFLCVQSVLKRRGTCVCVRHIHDNLRCINTHKHTNTYTNTHTHTHYTPHTRHEHTRHEHTRHEHTHTHNYTPHTRCSLDLDLLFEK